MERLFILMFLPAHFSTHMGPMLMVRTIEKGAVIGHGGMWVEMNVYTVTGVTLNVCRLQK